MVFSSLFFIFAFLPVVLLIYVAAPPRYRNAVAFGASCLFYAWGAPRFLFVLLGSSLMDYGVSRWIGPVRGRTPRTRRLLVAAAIALNLAVFLYFKYANFFVGELNHLLNNLGVDEIPWSHVALPIGISFFTFQKLSYLIDVYRGVVTPARSALSYTLYVCLFPQLIAGPIVRYHDIADQLYSRTLTAARMCSGIWRFCRGLGKKVLIANVLGEVADHAFGLGPDRLCFTEAWVGAVCYAFQIYFDFSGYSDMAIGLGRMLGFEFLENFNCPYVARNFSEFWRRWHISLSNWMREYLYIPLGGNRISKPRTYLNLWIVFLLSGLWHGAAWNFVVWGAYHGVFLCFSKWRGERGKRPLPDSVAIPLTFGLLTLGWVFFRAASLDHALMYLERMLFFASTRSVALGNILNPHATFILGVAAFFSFVPALRGPYRAWVRFWNDHSAMTLAVEFILALALLLLSACSLAAGRFNPFIYFRF